MVENSCCRLSFLKSLFRAYHRWREVIKQTALGAGATEGGSQFVVSVCIYHLKVQPLRNIWMRSHRGL